MSKGFNLTAELNLRGPSNIRSVVSDIRRQIGTVSATVTPVIDKNGIKSISSEIKKQLGSITGNVNVRLSPSSSKTLLSDIKKQLSSVSANINISANASSIKSAGKTIKQQLSGLVAPIGVSVSAASINQIRSRIRNQLGSLNVTVNVRLNANVNQTLNAYNANLTRLNNLLTQTTTNATAATNSINALAAAMRSASGVRLQPISTNLGNIGTGANRASQAIGGATSEIENFGRQAGLAIRRFTAFSTVAGVVYGITSALKSGISSFIEYDQQLTRISQVTGDAKDKLGSITSTINQLSTSLGVSSTELASTTLTLAQAGLTAKDTERALKALALSALAPSFDDMNQTVEGSIALMRQFNIGSSQLENALGSINAVSAKFAVEASDIITAIQRTGGVFAASSKGVSEGTQALNEFISVFTSIRATTRESAETIATGLRTIFTRIQRAETIEALKEFGVTLTDLEGKFVGPYIAVQRLSEGLGRLDPRDLKFSSIVEELGGFRQIGKVLPLIQQFSTAQEALKVAQEGQGSLASDAAKGQQALAVQIAKVRQEFLALIRSVGNTDTFQNIVRVGLDLASALIKVADAAKGLVPLLGLFAALKGAQAVTQFAGGFGRGFRGIGPGQRAHEGGMIRHFATGGYVPGVGNSDTVPARLTPGEFVIRKKAVQAIGVGKLHALNRYADGGIVQKFAGGGLAQARIAELRGSSGKAKGAATINELQNNKKVYVQDSDTVSAHINRERMKLSQKDFQELKRSARDTANGNRKWLPGGIARYNKTVWADTFENIVAKKKGYRIETSRTNVSKLNPPTDLVGPNGEIGEVKFTGEGKSVSDTHVLSKLLRQKYTNKQLTFGRKGGFTKNENDMVGLGAIQVFEPENKEDFEKWFIAQSRNKKKLSQDPKNIKRRAENAIWDTFALGGSVRKFETAGPVTPTAGKRAGASEIIRALGAQAAAKAGGISSTDVYTILNKRNPNPEQLAIQEKIRTEFLKKTNRLAGAEKAKTTRATSKGLIFGAAGMMGSAFSPINKTINSDLLKSPVSVRIVSGLMNPEVASSLDQSFSSAISKTAKQAAKKVMVTDILSNLGLGRELNLDFDRTLAFGADKVLADPKTPKFAEFGDRSKVGAALKKAKLSLLGRELVGMVSKKPELLSSLRLITARPPSTLDLVHQWLSSQGLPIPLSQFKGLGGPGVSGSQIAKLKASLLSPGSVFVDDDVRNVKAAKARSKEGITAYRYGNRKSIRNTNADGTAQGVIFERMIEQLGGPSALKGQGLDFPNGLKGAAKYFGIPGNIPTDAKRTISGPSTVEDNIITYLKNVKGYNFGGIVQKFAVGGLAQSKDTLEKYFTDAAPINLGLANSKSLSKNDRKSLASDVRNLRQLRTPAPEELYSSLSRNAFDKFAMDTGLNKNPDIPKDTKFNNRQTYYAQEVAKIIGKTFNLPGFVSTSKNYTVAKSFLDNAPRAKDNWAAMLTVKTKKNAQGVDVAEQLKDRKINVTKQDINPRTGKMETFFMKQPHEENEVMLSPRSRFRVNTAKYVDLMGRHNLWANVQQYAIGGSVDDTVPALLTPGEFVINKKAASRIGMSRLNSLNHADKHGVRGFNKGGPVGNIQEFAVGGAVQRFFFGGSPVKARPDNPTAFNIKIPDTLIAQLNQVTDALEQLGVRSSSTAELFRQGGAISYQAATTAMEADVQRMKIAGASASAIYQAEQRLNNIRQSQAKDLNTRQQLKGLSGAQLQDIDSRADVERQKLIKKQRKKLVASGLSADEIEEQLSSEKVQDKINKKSYQKAATQTLGSSAANNLFKNGVSGSDIDQYTKQAMMDKKTLAQMDAQLRKQKEKELMSSSAYGSASDSQKKKMLSALKQETDNEIKTRRQLVNDLAKQKGMTGPGSGRMSGQSLMGAAFGIQTLGSLLAQNINAESNIGNAQMSAGLQGATNSIGVGAMITGGAMDLVPEKFAGLAGGIGLAITAVMAVGQAFIDARNAAIEFEKKLADRKTQEAMESVAKSFEKLSTDIKNIKIQEDITKNLIEASNNVKRSIEADSRTGKAFWANILDVFTSNAPTGINSQSAAASRSKILDKQGIGAYAETTTVGQNPLKYLTSFFSGDFTTEITNAEKRRSELMLNMIPETAREQSKKYAEVAQGMEKLVEEKLRGGTTLEDILTNPSHEFDNFARTIAMADQATHAHILAIQQDTALSSMEKEARIQAVSALYAEDRVRKSAKTIDIEKQAKNFDKNIDVLSRSLERMFQNMEQSIEKNNFSLNLMSQNMDLINASLSGGAKTGNTSLRSINVLQNPRAYSANQSEKARSQAASFFTGEQNMVKGLLSVGDNLETSIMATINKTLTENPSETNEKVGMNIEKEVKNQISKLQLPPDVGDKLGEQVRVALDQIRKRGDEKINFGDLMEKIPSLSKVLESSKRAQEVALKALEHWQEALNTYSEKINQLTDLQIDSNEKLRRSTDLVINGQMELASVLGKDISVSAVKSARNSSIAQRTGGATDPDSINKNILALEGRRRGLEASANMSSNKGLAGAADFVKFKNELLDTNVALRENHAALKALAESGEVASAALNKVQIAQQKQAGKVGLLEKLVTNTPEEANALGQAMQRLQNNINGQLNTINNSAGAQKAYTSAINDGATAAEAMKAAQTAFANERKETLGTLNELLPFLGNTQQGNNIKANVLESMVKESGMGVSPMIQQVLNSLRNPQADPETQQAIQQYQAAIAEQAKANTLLAQLNDTLASDIARASAEALSKALTGSSIEFKNAQLDDIAKDVKSIALKSGENPVPAVGKAAGGIIYAAAGGVNFQPRGTDTVPAMLTPGEFVVNRQATSQYLPLLKSINSGSYSKGGSVKYYSSGGYVSDTFKDEYLNKNNLERSEKEYIDPEDPAFQNALKGASELTKVYSGWKNFTRLQPTSAIYYSSRHSLADRYTAGMFNPYQDVDIPFDTSGKLVVGTAADILNDNGVFKYGAAPDPGSLTPTALGYLVSNSLLATKKINKGDISSYKDVIRQFMDLLPPDSLWGSDAAHFDIGSLSDVTGGSGGTAYKPNLKSSKNVGALLGKGDISSVLNKRPTGSVEGIQKIFKESGLFTGETGGLYGTFASIVSAGNLPNPASVPGSTSILDISDTNDSLKWIKDPKDIASLKTTQEANIKTIKETQQDIVANKIVWLKNAAKNNRLISLQDKLEKIYENGSLIEEITPDEREILDLTKIRLADKTGNFSLLSQSLDGQLSKRVSDLAKLPPDQQLEKGKDNAQIATLSRLGRVPKWADSDPLPIGYSEAGVTKPPKLFPWIANVEPDYFLSDLKQQIEEQTKDRLSGKSKGFDISETGFREESAKLPAPLDKLIWKYEAGYTKYSGRLYDTRNEKLDDTRKLTDAYIINPNSNNPLNIFKNSKFPERDFYTGFPGEYTPGDLAKRIIIDDPQTILDYMTGIKNNDPNLNSLEDNIKNAKLLLGPSLLKVMNNKPVNLPEQLYYGMDRGNQSIDITEYIIASAKNASAQLRNIAIEQSSKVNNANLKTDTISDANIIPAVQNLSKSSLQIFGRKVIPGFSSGWLYNAIGKGLYNLNTPDKAKNLAGYISSVFSNAVTEINKINPKNQNQFDALREINILATGAANVFGGLSSGNTNYIKQFLSSGTAVEELFRSLGAGSFFNQMGGQELSKDFTNVLGANLKNSKKATIGKDGSIALADISEQDIPKTYTDLVKLATNPYNEFNDRSIRQSIFGKLIRDIPTFRADNTIRDPKTSKEIKQRSKSPLFSSPTQKMIIDSLTSLSHWYGGFDKWLGQDYLNENIPGTTYADRADTLASSWDPGLYTKATSANRFLGALNEFGDIPSREWLMARGSAKMPKPKEPVKLATGGMVYAAGGQLINFQPRGTDTVPAMLTPGEFVVNRAATQQHLPLLRAINSGADAYSSGGVVYAAEGTYDPITMAAATAGGAGLGANAGRIFRGIGSAFTSPLSLRGMGSGLTNFGARTFPWTTAALRGIGSLGANGIRMGARGIGSFLGVGNIVRAFGSVADIPALQAAYEQAGNIWAQSQSMSASQLSTQPWLRGGNIVNSQGQLVSSAQGLNKAKQALDAGRQANSFAGRAARGLPLVGKAAGRLLSGAGFALGAYEGFNADTDKTGRSRLTNTVLGAATGSGTTMGDVGATSITGSQFGGNLLQAGLTTAQYAALGIPLPIAAGLAAGTITTQEVAGLMGDMEKNKQAEARATKTANIAYSGDEKHLSGLTGVEAVYVRLIARLEKQLLNTKTGTPEYDKLKERLDTERNRNVTERTKGILWGTNTTTTRRMGFNSSNETLDQAIAEHRAYEARIERNQAEQARLKAEEEKRVQENEQRIANVNSTVSTVRNGISAVQSTATNLFNQSTGQLQAIVNKARSNNTRTAAKYLEKPATPDLLDQTKKLRDQRQEAIDEVRRLDSMYEQDLAAAQANKDDAKVRSIQKQYKQQREAALSQVADIDNNIIATNAEKEDSTTPEERNNAWKQYADNKEKESKDKAIAEARYQNLMEKKKLKGMAEAELAVAKITGITPPQKKDNPESFFRWRNNAMKALGKKFRLSGNAVKDAKLLAQYGMPSETAQLVTQPISKEEAGALMQMMASSGKYSKNDLGLLTLTDEQIEFIHSRANSPLSSATDVMNKDKLNKMMKEQQKFSVKTTKQLSRFGKVAESAANLNPVQQVSRRFTILRNLAKQGLIQPGADAQANSTRLQNLGMSQNAVGFLFGARQQPQPNGMSNGGVVYAAGGTLIPYQPRGTDTVPAMLTPGEFVVNRAATQANLPLLKSINRSKGGSIGYYAEGGLAENSIFSSDTQQSQNIRNNQENLRLVNQNLSATNENKKISQDTQKIAQKTASQIPLIQNENAKAFAKTNTINSNTNNSVQKLTKKIDNFGNFMGFSSGGLVYAANGMMIPYSPKGTDTVPAMLTPGEFVVNRASTQANLPLLHAINQSKGGDIKGFADGGVVYAQEGQLIDPNNIQMQTAMLAQQAMYLGRQQADMAGMFVNNGAPFQDAIAQPSLIDKNNNSNYRYGQNKININNPQDRKNIYGDLYKRLVPYTSGPDGALSLSRYFSENNGFSQTQIMSNPELRPRGAYYSGTGAYGINQRTGEMVQANTIFVPNPIIDTETARHELGHSLIANLGSGAGLPVQAIPSVSLFVKSFLANPKYKNKTHSSHTLSNNPLEILPTLLEFMDAPEFSKSGGHQALKDVMRAYGFNRGGVVYAQQGQQIPLPEVQRRKVENYIPFKTLRDKQLAERRSAYEKAQQEKNARMRMESYARYVTNQDEIERRRAEENSPEAIQERQQRAISGASSSTRSGGFGGAGIQYNQYGKPYNKGGVVYAAEGALVNYQPRGTDTVPAMLTPGEFVVNRASTQQHLPLLKAINSGYYRVGGRVSRAQLDSNRRLYLERQASEREERRDSERDRLEAIANNRRFLSEDRRNRSRSGMSTQIRNGRYSSDQTAVIPVQAQAQRVEQNNNPNPFGNLTQGIINLTQGIINLTNSLNNTNRSYQTGVQTGTPSYLTSSINTPGVTRTQEFFEKRRLNQEALQAENDRRLARRQGQRAIPAGNEAELNGSNLIATFNNRANQFTNALNIATSALGQFNQQLTAGMTQNSVSNNGRSGITSLDGISQFTQTFQSFIDQLKNINPVINMTGTHTVVVEFGASAGIFRNMEAGIQDFVTHKINDALSNLSRGTEGTIPTYQV